MSSYLESENNIYRFAYIMGLLLLPGFWLLDLVVYPQFIWSLLKLRAGVTAYLFIAFILNGRIKKSLVVPLATLSVMVAGSMNSYICYLTGDGFASPYYAGTLIIILVASSFFQMEARSFAVLLAMLVAQHFVILGLVPFEWTDLFVNIAVVGAFVFAGFALQNHSRRLISEINQLRGIIPICAACKQIRDDEGFWHQLEAYLCEHAEVDFSHGFCPSCLAEAKKEIEELDRQINGNSSPDEIDPIVQTS